MSAHDTVCTLLEKLNQDFVKSNIIKYKLKAVYEQILKTKENQAAILTEMSNLEVFDLILLFILTQYLFVLMFGYLYKDFFSRIK